MGLMSYRAPEPLRQAYWLVEDSGALILHPQQGISLILMYLL